MEENTRKKIKDISIQDIKEFFSNINFSFKLGKKIFGNLFYKNLLFQGSGRTLDILNTVLYGLFIDAIINNKDNLFYIYALLTVYLTNIVLDKTLFFYIGEKLQLEQDLLLEKIVFLEKEKISEISVNHRLSEEFNSLDQRMSNWSIVRFFKDLEISILSLYTIIISAFAVSFVDYRIIIITVIGVFIGFKLRIETEKKISNKENLTNAYSNYKWAHLGNFKTSNLNNIDDNIGIGQNFKFLSKKFEDYLDFYFKFRRDIFKNTEKYKRLSNYVFALITAISYFIIFNNGIGGTIEIGILIIVFTTYDRLYQSIDSILTHSSSFTKNYIDLTYTKKFYDYTPPKETYQEIPSKDELELEFKNVSFIYPSSKSEVLKDINFKLKKGDILAIIGSNGAGKSTLTKLIFKLYRPTTGTILLNGVNIHNTEDKEYLDLFHILPQQFECEEAIEIKELIYLGDTTTDMDMERVTKAAKLSLADEFIENLEKKYEQKLYFQSWIDWFNKHVKENMVNLSAGQIRKIQLARLFYSHKPIIFMDEPTSNIDPESTNKIFKNLTHLQNNQILVFITHNLLNISLANKIMIIDKGQIVEFGDKKTLMSDKSSKLNEQLNFLKIE